MVTRVSVGWGSDVRPSIAIEIVTGVLSKAA